MSRHRTEVFELAEALLKATRAACTEPCVQDLLARGVRSVTVRAVTDASTPAALLPLKRAIDTLVDRSKIDDLKAAAVLVDLTPRERIGRCVGPVVSSRRFNIVDVRVTAEVETRWVHVLPQAEFTKQWVIA